MLSWPGVSAQEKVDLEQGLDMKHEGKGCVKGGVASSPPPGTDHGAAGLDLELLEAGQSGTFSNTQSLMGSVHAGKGQS